MMDEAFESALIYENGSFSFDYKKAQQHERENRGGEVLDLELADSLDMVNEVDQNNNNNNSASAPSRNIISINNGNKERENDNKENTPGVIELDDSSSEE